MQDFFYVNCTEHKLYHAFLITLTFWIIIGLTVLSDRRVLAHSTSFLLLGLPVQPSSTSAPTVFLYLFSADCEAADIATVGGFHRNNITTTGDVMDSLYPFSNRVYGFPLQMTKMLMRSKFNTTKRFAIFKAEVLYTHLYARSSCSTQSLQLLKYPMGLDWKKILLPLYLISSSCTHLWIRKWSLSGPWDS